MFFGNHMSGSPSSYVAVPPLAWAFGSRVLGTAKKFSDLDIAIEAEDELSIGTLGDLRYAFAESNLPISVDLLDMRTVRKPFKQIVEGQRVPLN